MIIEYKIIPSPKVAENISKRIQDIKDNFESIGGTISRITIYPMPDKNKFMIIVDWYSKDDRDYLRSNEIVITSRNALVSGRRLY